jgi:hypothetical protein
MAKCAYREHLLRQRPPRHAPRFSGSALVAIQIAPRLYERKCGASRDEENAFGGGSPLQTQLHQWPEAVGARAGEKRASTYRGAMG